MCGRFTLTSDMETLSYRFADIAHMQLDYTPRYNIAPSQPVISIISDKNSQRMGYFNWGLVPFWASDKKIGHNMINARSETLHQKPAYKRLLASKRCLIPATGFFEWKKENKKNNQCTSSLKINSSLLLLDFGTVGNQNQETIITHVQLLQQSLTRL